MKGTVLLFALCYFLWKCSTGEARATCPIINGCPEATEAHLDKGLCSRKKLVPMGTAKCNICGIFRCSPRELNIQRMEIKSKSNKPKNGRCEKKCQVQPGKCRLEEKYDYQRNCVLCPEYVECGHKKQHGGIVA